MATLKQRVHRMNSSGSYDTVHYETSSDLVLRPSGRTVEQDLTDYLPKVQNSDTAPSSLSAGSILTGNTLAWIGLNNKILELKKSSDIDITRGYSSSTTSLASRTIDESSISVMLLIMMANRADTSFLTYNKTTIKYAYKTSIYTLTRSTTSQQRVDLNMLYVYFNTNNTITFGTSSYIEDYYFYVA